MSMCTSARIACLLFVIGILPVRKIYAQTCSDSTSQQRFGGWLRGIDSVHARLRSVSTMDSGGRAELAATVRGLSAAIAPVGFSALRAHQATRLQQNLADVEQLIAASMGVWPPRQAADTSVKALNDPRKELALAQRPVDATPRTTAPNTLPTVAPDAGQKGTYPLLDDIKDALQEQRDSLQTAIGKSLTANQTALLQLIDSTRSLIISRSQDEFARTQWLQYLQLAALDFEALKAELRHDFTCPTAIREFSDTLTLRLRVDPFLIGLRDVARRSDTLFLKLLDSIISPPSATATARWSLAGVLNPPVRNRASVSALARLNVSWHNIFPMGLVGGWIQSSNSENPTFLRLGSELAAGISYSGLTALPGLVIWNGEDTSVGGSLLYTAHRVGIGLSYFSDDKVSIRLYWRPN